MTQYNPKNRNSDYDAQSRIRQVDDLFQMDEMYDVYDDDGTYEGSARAARPASQRTSSADSASRQAAARSSSQRNRSTVQSSRSGSADSARYRQAGSRSGSAGSQQVRRVSSAQKAIRRKKKKFKKLLRIYIAVLLVILIIGSIAFTLYLSSYENSQPSHTAESIVNSYASQEGIVNFVTANADKSNLMGNVDEIAQLYATNIAGKTISYKENKDFRPDSPSYDITADGSTVAKVTLNSKGSGWDISNLDIAPYLPNTASVSIEVPSGSLVSVNGSLLDSSYITSSQVPEVLQNSLQFISNPPNYDTYVVSGLVSDPSITVTSASGEALELTRSENTYVASGSADASFVASVEDRVYDAIDNYATYFIHMSFSLANYIVYGSELYSYIFGSDEMNPIDTNLYNWEQIESYDFAERSASNFVQYTDDCFTVDVKYALDMYFTDPSYSDNNQTMDATWVFVIEPLDGSWCISDIIAH